ncbi:MAG TPA: aminofutalosine synthase MqnE [Phaeodactylibacter sp.]|nr:aminofutalosine synthase MqnE [Phaeodactylibacter sp.]
MSTTFIEHLLRDQRLSADLRAIAEKVASDRRITPEEGLTLYEKAEPAYLAVLANHLREQRHGNSTYFNRNFHLEPTNVCLYTCAFCSYSRKYKKREEGWEYSMDELMEMIRKYDDQPVTEVHIVGGVMPQYDFAFYTELFRRIRRHRPDLHIKALTPVEYHYIFKKAKLSYEEGMAAMKEAGLDSMPGGGAEIFDDKIRDQIAGGKCSAEEWLSIHRIWHGLGMRSNATMLYGHIEQFHHRIDHLERLRQLQDETGGFQTFIPLKFRNQNNEMSHLPEVSVVEDLRNYAISRIYLDNFDHIKAYWPMIGRETARISLGFGVDDIDGTIDDTTKIYSMAGAEEQNPAMSTRELVELIRSAGREAVERDSLYNIIKDYHGHVFEDEEDFNGYTSLPVVH